MRISHSHRFVFLAYPRTASTSTRNLLDPFCEVKSVHISEVTATHPFYHHISAGELLDVFRQRGWDWDSYRKFTIIRNPYDRVVSLYHHHAKQYGPARERRSGPLLRFARMFRRKTDFAAYVKALNPDQRLHTKLRSFVCDSSGRWLVGDILRFENLGMELSALLPELGVTSFEGVLPRLNGSTDREDYRMYYNGRSRRRVGDLYAEEIELFGYAF
jgi:hypothetical protein